MASLTLIYTTFFLWVAALVAARHGYRGPLQLPAEVPAPGKFTSQGCFESLGGAVILHEQKAGVANSPGWCLKRCKKEGRLVGAMHMSTCYCMDTYPPRLAHAQDDLCSYPCPGYPFEACGGSKAYSVHNTGLKMDVEYHDDQAKDAPGPITSTWNEIVDAVEDLWTEAGELTEKARESFDQLTGNSGAEQMRHSEENMEEL